jgi:hypothetical protein
MPHTQIQGFVGDEHILTVVILSFYTILKDCRKKAAYVSTIPYGPKFTGSGVALTCRSSRTYQVVITDKRRIKSTMER